MRLLATVALLGSSIVAAQELVRGAHKRSPMAGSDIVARSNLGECETIPPPFSCERSCGSGYAPCVFDLLCYNPSAGESCCADGSYCPADTYCSDAGCCSNELSLEECGASTRISIIPPTGTLATSRPTTNSSASESESETSETRTETPTGTGPISTPPTTTGPSGSGGIPTPTGGNSTVTTQGPPTQPSNAAVPLKGAAGTFALGWVGVLLALL